MKCKLDINKYHSFIYFTFEDYYRLYSYVNDEVLHEKHIDSYKNNFEEYHKKLSLKFDGKIRDLYSSISKVGIKNTFGTFSNHLVVFYITQLEQLFSEYFISLFKNSPQKMFNYVNENGNEDKRLNGMVSLNLIIGFSNYDELIDSLAKKTSIHATKGSYKNVIKSIEQLSNYSFPSNLKSDIYDLFETRNKIVHESDYFPVDFNTMQENYKTMLHFIIEVGRAFKSLGYGVEGEDLLKEETA